MEKRRVDLSFFAHLLSHSFHFFCPAAREAAVEEREATANQEEQQILTKKEHLEAKAEKLNEEEQEVG